jgi:hypothetical protein
MTETMTMTTECAGVPTRFTELRHRYRAGRLTTYEYLTYLKVHRGIDCFGMSKDELSKMVKVGYDQWLAEYEAESAKSQSHATGTVRCALGSKCLNAHNRKAAFGTGKYCSAACRGAAQAAKSREKRAWQASNPEMVGIQ